MEFKKKLAIGAGVVATATVAMHVFNKCVHIAATQDRSLDNIPDLAYNHNKILDISKHNLKKLIISTDVLNGMFPNGFTLPELQKVYETILEKTFDRRNFRKKLLGMGLIKDANTTEIFEGKKPAKKYIFNDSVENKEIL